MRELTAKNFAQDKATEIIELCDDLKCINNKELKILGIEKIQKLAYGILEHLEYLDIKEINEEV
jgi:hypothetical protein